jgi:DnaJ-class molecular chaperone
MGLKSEFMQDLDNMEDLRCRTCGGMGACNDAEPGDIFYKSWRCETCKGTGYATEARCHAGCQFLGVPHMHVKGVVGL